MNVPRKYGLLRVVAFILKLLAWVVLVAALAGSVLLLVGFDRLAANTTEVLRYMGVAGLIATPLIGVVWFIQLFAFGSILSLLIDVEENTRALSAQAHD